MMILKSSTKIMLLLYFILLAIPGRTQDNDNMILKAMKDEMKRSMTEIKYEGHEKPFFISYGINDVQNFMAYASLGAMIQSGEYKSRSKSVRVLVGDYEFNDESLDNNLFSETTANEIQLPLEDDYFGIRRALWTTTDVVYKGAAQKYKKHQSTLKEQNKTLKDLPHRTFAKVPVVQSIAPALPYKLEKEKWESYCKKLSSVFRSYPAIESSDVMMNVSYGSQYFVNSEGTVVVKPYRIAVINCRAQVKTEKGEPIFENIIHYGSMPEEFPVIEDLMVEVKSLADKLIALRKSNTLEEEYSGPVLFLGAPVAEVFASTLFSYREALVASNAIVSATDFRPDAASTLDARIGKLIVDNTLTIKSNPKLKKFRDIPLLGTYDLDDEGVAPPDELILVENGILKTLLNDRSLTSASQVANGHSSGPAVIEIYSNKTSATQQLKESLIQSARKDGLDYGIIIRGKALFGEGVAEVWKVNLDTGEEELLRSAQLGEITLKNLKRIGGSERAQEVHTVQTADGNLASFIVPASLLLEQVDISPLKLPYFDQEEIYLESPLNN